MTNPQDTQLLNGSLMAQEWDWYQRCDRQVCGIGAAEAGV